MPVSYKILPEKKLMVLHYTGELTVEEILNVRKEGAADPDSNPAYHVIDDITGVTFSKINFNDLSRISGQSVATKGVKRALVAETELQFGMARMYQILSESYGQIFQIFRDYDAASEWVLEPDTESIKRSL
ncbi:MAG: hypothetical protein KAU21_15345 [Gammaproteobacteria bacterium]|nr:hypothetical protein [Gammaproteobacteria bacterium]